MRVSVIFLLLVVTQQSLAQMPDSVVSKPNRKLQYFFYLQSGVMIGNVDIPEWCSDCNEIREVTFSATTIHGVKWGNLRVGGGLGFDSYYGWNTVPVMGSVSWDLHGKRQKQNSLVIQMNYGTTLITKKINQYDEYGLESTEGGVMINPSIGYRILYDDLNLMLNVGLKQQVVQSSYKYPTYFWDPVTGQQSGEPSYSHIKETLNRLVISLAVGLR